MLFGAHYYVDFGKLAELCKKFYIEMVLQEDGLQQIDKFFTCSDLNMAISKPLKFSGSDIATFFSKLSNEYSPNTRNPDLVNKNKVITYLVRFVLLENLIESKLDLKKSEDYAKQLKNYYHTNIKDLFVRSKKFNSGKAYFIFHNIIYLLLFAAIYDACRNGFSTIHIFLPPIFTVMSIISRRNAYPRLIFPPPPSIPKLQAPSTPTKTISSEIKKSTNRSKKLPCSLRHVASRLCFIPLTLGSVAIAGIKTGGGFIRSMFFSRRELTNRELDAQWGPDKPLKPRLVVIQPQQPPLKPK